MFFFFFSSRRRHTRCLSDWSSDVCSSDLEPTGVIYHNEFIDNWYTYLGYGIAVNGSPSTWKGSVTLGSENALFIEDNFFDLNRHCVTASNGAIYVARYNTVKDNYQDAGAFDAHGLTPSWPRGTRSVEIYNNT